MVTQLAELAFCEAKRPGEIIVITPITVQWLGRQVVRNAALALSLAAYCEDNVDRLGQLPGCVDTLLYLSQEGEACVQAQALVAIANLAYSHPKNQVR